jgi:hypothetical protein
MTVTTTCCSAYNFPSDDTIAIDYADICNSSSRTLLSAVFAGLAAIFMAIYLI